MFRFTVLVFLCLFCSIYASPAAEQLPLSLQNPVHTADKWEYEDCGTPQHIIQIDSITVNPDPPQPGKDLTVTVTANAVSPVEEGAYADVSVKLGLIKLLQKRFDLCEEARNANSTVQCPVQAGQYTVQQTVSLPKEIPRAKFNVDVKGYTAEDEDLCQDASRISPSDFLYVRLLNGLNSSSTILCDIKICTFGVTIRCATLLLWTSHSMPTSTVAFDVMFEFANDTSQAVTLQLAAQGSEPNHVTPIILLQSGESVSLVLVAGSSYRYTVKQHSRKAQICVKAWQDTRCAATEALSGSLHWNVQGVAVSRQ